MHWLQFHRLLSALCVLRFAFCVLRRVRLRFARFVYYVRGLTSLMMCCGCCLVAIIRVCCSGLDLRLNYVANPVSGFQVGFGDGLNGLPQN